MSTMLPVIWSVVRYESPTARAADPGPAGVTIPDDVLDWAAGHGLSETDRDVYVLVCPQDEADEIPNEVAWMQGELPEADVARIWQALAEK